MPQCEGVRGWIGMDSGEVQVNRRDIGDIGGR